MTTPTLHGDGEHEREVAVVGVGNVLSRDDGVGVRVVRELQDRVHAGEIAWPGPVRLIDGGTLGGSLVSWIAGASALLIVDAADLGLLPGATVTFECPLSSLPQSSGGLGELLTAARLAGIAPERFTLVAIQSGSTDPGVSLTAPVEAALPSIVETARAEIERLGEAAA